MAQDDIVDLDPFLEALGTSTMIKTPDPIADLPYRSRGPMDFDTDIKNFLVEKAGASKNLIDTLVGGRGTFRDRAFGSQYTDEGLKLPQRGLIPELFSPTDAGTQAAERAGVSKENPAREIAEYAAYLPEDVYETGVQKLIRQYYNNNFDTPLDFDYEFQREPYNKEIIYKDPTTNEFTYVNPPGLDMGNLKAVGTQLFPEILGGLTGAASTMNPQRRVTGPITGGIGGYAAATGAAELAGVGDITKGVMQGAGTVAGALSGTGQAAVTPIVLGETVGGFLTRYQTLKDLKNKGLLNETYDEEKLYKTALKDAGVTFLFGVGANALGTAIIKASSKGGYGIEGFDYDAFESAFDDLKAAAAGDPAAERVIATATVPEIMEAGNVGSPITREAFQSNILDAASGGGDQAKLVKARLDEARRAREEGLDTQIGIADPSMPTKTGTVKEELRGLENK